MHMPKKMKKETMEKRARIRKRRGRGRGRVRLEGDKDVTNFEDVANNDKWCSIMWCIEGGFGMI